jgi:Icc-related predicted phosphoesterase
MNSKITIAGNHENIPDLIYYCLTNTNFLLDETLEVMGIKFHGCRFKSYNVFNWFMNDNQAKLNFDEIPSDVDILLSHQPGISKFRRYNEALEKKILEIKPKMHFFGHIHEAYGMYETNDTLFVCGSNLISKKERQVRDPIVIDFPVPKRL